MAGLAGLVEGLRRGPALGAGWALTNTCLGKGEKRESPKLGALKVWARQGAGSVGLGQHGALDAGQRYTPHICIWRYQKSFSCALFAVSVVQQGVAEFALDLEPEIRSCLSLR